MGRRRAPARRVRLDRRHGRQRREGAERAAGPDRARILRAARLLLQGIGETGLRRDQRATPRRVADTWTAEIVSGYRADPARILGKTIPTSGHDMVVVRDIPFTSVCVHHLLPFQGPAHVAY